MIYAKSEAKGEKEADYSFTNMDPAAAALAMQQKQEGYEAIVVWNPFVMETLNKRDDVHVLADSTAIPGEIVDGNDVLAVYDATKRAVDFARGGGGTVMLEMKTFRMKGHAEHDDAKYVPPELVEEWKQKDPLLRYDAVLEAEGILTARERELRTAELKTEIDTDAEFAVGSPVPDPGYAHGGIHHRAAESK